LAESIQKELIGLIGLGTIGSIFAGHLLNTEGRLGVYDIDPDRVDSVVKLGATAFLSSSALAESCSSIILALSDPFAVASVLEGEKGVLETASEGTLLLDLSTIDPSSCRHFQALASARGLAYVEAPISGGEPGGAGTDGAQAANVSFMIGGESEHVARAAPLLSILGARFFHMGPAGAGATVKLISNHIAGLTNLVCAEAFVLGAALGLTPERLLEVFDGTDAKSFWMMHYMAPRLKSGNFLPGFSIDLQHKDHRLAGEMASKFQVPMPLNDLALELYDRMRSAGLGGKDVVDAVNYVGKHPESDICSASKKTEV